MVEVRNKFHSLRLLGVIALLGGASIAHANPEDPMPAADRSALSALDSAVDTGLEHVASNPKKQLPKIKKKNEKKTLPGKIKVKDEDKSEDPDVPDATSGPEAVSKYSKSKELLNDGSPAQSAITSVKNDELNNKENAVAGVPIDANLSPLRRAIIDRARGELGKVEGKPDNPVSWKNPITGKTIKLKVGIDRLFEYTAVAFGTNVSSWLNATEMEELMTEGQKHTTWCGIFALWALKTGAGVAASDFAQPLQAVVDAKPALAAMVALVSHIFTPPGMSSSNKQLYQNIQWDTGGVFLYDSQNSSVLVMDGDISGSGNVSGAKHQLHPTGIQDWLIKKKSVPPIKPGDIGFTQELSPTKTNHLYVIERILEVDGKYIYFTVEGNYNSASKPTKNQMVVRNYRVYVPGYDYKNPSIPSRHVIEAWYDIEEMPRDTNNRHKNATGKQL